MYEFSYNFNTVLYQFLETGTLDKTFMGRDQELKLLAFSLYPLSFFLYSPFKPGKNTEFGISLLKLSFFFLLLGAKALVLFGQ